MSEHQPKYCKKRNNENNLKIKISIQILHMPHLTNKETLLLSSQPKSKGKCNVGRVFSYREMCRYHV